jgi:hypothetical protein
VPGLSLVVLLSLAAAPPAEDSHPWAVLVPALIKVRPGVEVPGRTSISLLAARGECEGFQVLVRPPADGVTVTATPLRLGRSSLKAELFREGFVRVETPSNSEGAAGPWPDPLLPLEPSGRSTPAAPLVVYGEICVPPEQPPGRYAGRVRVRAEGKRAASLLVTLEVQPFAIPATSSLPNSFGLSLYSVARGHRLRPPEARPLLYEYARALLRHRVTAHGLTMDGPTPETSFDVYDAEMAPFFEGSALPNGARFTSAEVRDLPRAAGDALRLSHYQRFAAHFRARQWGAQLFLYAKDEPRPEDVPLVLEQSRRARAAGVPLLVTTPYGGPLAGAADILCPTLNCFFRRPGPQTCPSVVPADRLREKLGPGVRIWWYQSCNSHGCDGGPADAPEIERAYTGWASYLVDHPPTRNRAMGPLAFLAGVDGELYYDTVQAYGTQDPWESVFAFGGNGDGTLFYPGRPDRIGGNAHRPVESLRLKHLRDGLEDYEYLRLLAARDPALARRSVQRLARSGYEIERDPRIWEAVRREVASAIARSSGPARAR